MTTPTTKPGATVLDFIAVLDYSGRTNVGRQRFTAPDGLARNDALADLRALMARCEQAEAHAERLAAALIQARERFVGLMAEHSRLPGDMDDEALESAERWTRENEPWEAVASAALAEWKERGKA